MFNNAESIRKKAEQLKSEALKKRTLTIAGYIDRGEQLDVALAVELSELERLEEYKMDGCDTFMDYCKIVLGVSRSDKTQLYMLLWLAKFCDISTYIRVAPWCNFGKSALYKLKPICKDIDNAEQIRATCREFCKTWDIDETTTCKVIQERVSKYLKGDTPAEKNTDNNETENAGDAGNVVNVNNDEINAINAYIETLEKIRVYAQGNAELLALIIELNERVQVLSPAVKDRQKKNLIDSVEQSA